MLQGWKYKTNTPTSIYIIYTLECKQKAVTDITGVSTPLAFRVKFQIQSLSCADHIAKIEKMESSKAKLHEIARYPRVIAAINALHTY